MNSIDFFYLVSEPNFATQQAKKQALLVMPESTVFEWNYNLFTERSPEYIGSDGGPLSHPALSVESALKFFQLLDQSIRQSTADWMMILEPDVWLMGRPLDFPIEAGGVTRNLLDPSDRHRIESYLNRSITPYYSMAGGSIISTHVWRQKVSELDARQIESFFQVWPEAGCSDAFVSMVLWWFGIQIEDWPELFESHMGPDRRDSATVFHGIKTWYNYQ